jgi:hypothetical protein
MEATLNHVFALFVDYRFLFLLLFLPRVSAANMSPEYLGEEGQGEGPAGHPGAGARLWQVRGGRGHRGHAGEGRENSKA